jgi:hypothetical protein
MAGAFTGEGKNKQLTTAKENAKFVAIASQSAAAKPENSAGPKLIKKTGHNLVDKDLIVFTAITGGSGLVVGRPYWVKKINANEFELYWLKSLTEVVEFTTELKETTTEYVKLTEHVGAKTKRKATSFGAIVRGTCEDTTAHEIEATSAVTITWGMYWTEEAEGAGECVAISEIPTKVLAEGDIYKLTNGKLEDTAVA